MPRYPSRFSCTNGGKSPLIWNTRGDGQHNIFVYCCKHCTFFQSHFVTTPAGLFFLLELIVRKTIIIGYTFYKQPNGIDCIPYGCGGFRRPSRRVMSPRMHG